MDRDKDAGAADEAGVRLGYGIEGKGKVHSVDCLSERLCDRITCADATYDFGFLEARKIRLYVLCECLGTGAKGGPS